MINGNVRERGNVGSTMAAKGALNQDGPPGTRRLVGPYITFTFHRKSLGPMIFEVQEVVRIN